MTLLPIAEFLTLLLDFIFMNRTAPENNEKSTSYQNKGFTLHNASGT